MSDPISVLVFSLYVSNLYSEPLPCSFWNTFSLLSDEAGYQGDGF